MKDKIVSYDNRSNWLYWNTFALRSAGFAFNSFETHTRPEITQIVEKLINVEDSVSTLWQVSSEYLRTEILRLKANPNAEKTTELRSMRRAHKYALKRSFSELVENTLPQAISIELKSAISLQLQLEADCYDTYEKLQQLSSQRIKTALEDKKFVRALTWQNLELVNFLHSNDVFSSKRKPSKVREIENVLMSYITRYTTKNETIGDFGPVAWGTFKTSYSQTQCNGVHNIIAKRNQYVEDWAITAIAAEMSKVDSLLPWAKVRVSPLCKIDGDNVTFPFSRTSRLTTYESKILSSCNGARTAKEIVTYLQSDNIDFCEKQVYATLKKLSHMNIVRWAFCVPYYSHSPVQDLLKQSENIPGALLGHFKELSKFETIQPNENGDLGQTLSSLNKTFEILANTSSVRNRGKSYASRTICFEDCVQALTLDISNQVMDNLDLPLSAVLDSADWFVEQVAALYSKSLLSKFTKLASSKDIDRVPFVDFWLQVSGLFFSEASLPIDDIVVVLQQKWQSILQYSSDTNELSIQFDSIDSEVKASFNSNGSRWPQSAHHSPDVMLEAANLEAINEGRYQLVLGEVHVAYNTLMANFLMYQSNAHQTLQAQYREDIGSNRILPVFSPEATGVPMRTRWAFDHNAPIELLFSPDSVAVSPETALNIADLYVTNGKSGLIVNTYDGVQSFDLLDVFGEFLSHLCATKFQLFPKNKCLPRIKIDNLVINRRCWSFTFKSLAYLTRIEAINAFIEVQKWRVKQDVPDQIYVRVNWEKKPVFVDFNCPVTVRIFLKLIRKGHTENEHHHINFSEMKPHRSGLWLKDKIEEGFTSEFRVVAKRKQ